MNIKQSNLPFDVPTYILDYANALMLYFAERDIHNWKLGGVTSRALTERLEAKVDSLMLEYCPDEMTEEQKARWAKHQVPVEASMATWGTVVCELCYHPKGSSGAQRCTNPLCPNHQPFSKA